MIEILKVRQKNLKRIIEVVKKAIKQGKVLVCPTDTVYGLIADATNKEAVKKLFKIKKRLRRKPIPIFVKDIKMAKKLAKINKKQEDFLKKVWPGKVTVVLERKEGLPNILFGKEKTIGLRVPKYKLALEIIEKLNCPLAETSTNISGKPTFTKIKEIISQFKNKKNLPDLILDAGNLKKSLPSTVIDLTGIKPKILRIGEKAPQFK